MKQTYLEVTYRQGRPIAAYLYLPRGKRDKSVRTAKVDPGMIIDFAQDGRVIGVEIIAPALVTVSNLNQVLNELGVPPIAGEDLTPLKAA